MASPDHTCPKCGSTSMIYTDPMHCAKCNYRMGVKEIHVVAHPDYIEALARQVYATCRPQFSAFFSADGSFTGPTPLTWETEDETRRDWCRKRAIEIISGKAP